MLSFCFRSVCGEHLARLNHELGRFIQKQFFIICSRILCVITDLGLRPGQDLVNYHATVVIVFLAKIDSE